MPLVVGWKTKVLSQNQLSAACTHCHHNDLVMSVHQRYFTLFWIPTFPLKKQRLIVCINCSTIFTPDAYPVPSSQTRMPKTPWWAFSGLVLLVGIFTAGFFIAKHENEQTQLYAQDPRVGDVLIVSTKNDGKTWYTYFKIVRIDGDRIFFHPSQRSFSKINGVFNEYEKAQIGKELFDEVEEMTKEQMNKLNIESIKRLEP